MPKPSRGASTKVVPSSASSNILTSIPPVKATLSPQGEKTGKSLLETIAGAGNVKLRLDRYVVHEEDDGALGKGVDLYIGYLASGVFTSKSGTTPVVGGLTKNNGGQPRNAHEVNQELFSIPLPDGAHVVARLNLIESDETTAQIRQAYASAQLPNFTVTGPVQISAADVHTFYAVPFGPIIKLLSGSNTDDDYGHWNLDISESGGVVSCSVVDMGAYCHASPIRISIPVNGSASLSLKYVDGDNDIECVITLDR
jgi:hypothetical protein